MPRFARTPSLRRLGRILLMNKKRNGAGPGPSWAVPRAATPAAPPSASSPFVPLAAPAALRSGAARAIKGWCRRDPIVKIGDVTAHIVLSSYAEMDELATGASQLVITVPEGVPTGSSPVIRASAISAMTCASSSREISLPTIALSKFRSRPTPRPRIRLKVRCRFCSRSPLLARPSRLGASRGSGERVAAPSREPRGA